MRERGAALIAVLLLVAVLTALATAFAATSFSQRMRSARQTGIVQQDEVADAAIRLRLLQLVRAVSRGQPEALGEREVELPFGRATVTVDREDARIDLNFAEEDLLFAYFASNGMEKSAARQASRRILDWRDVDESTRLGGAERAEYRLAGHGAGPRNNLFDSVEEIRSVLGLRDVADSLLEGLTVYSRSAEPYAPPLGSPAYNAMRLADEQQLGNHHWQVSGPDGGTSALPEDPRGKVLRLTACAVAEPYKRCRRAIVRLTGATDQFMLVLDWRSVGSGVGAAAEL